ncbi:MAG: hypothetical protein AAFX87_08740 [Bacteroidota bacterium]
MKKLVAIVVLSLLIIPGFGQDAGGKGDKRKSKLETTRIAFLSEKLGLTPDQAEKFWPVYNEFRKQRQSIGNEYKTIRQEFDAQNATEEERKKFVQLGLQFKQRQLDLEKTYSDRLLKIITSQQLLRLRRGEEEFRKFVLDQLRRRQQQQQQRRQQYRDQQNQRQQNRRNN